ncbi:MAG TPA: FAD-dependent oxidoreductase [Solirubrobacteraceae bacterium]|jgi:thioredoxin reductase (NADPH)
MEAATPRAPKPALITVDDDPGVARAVQRDLRRRYGDRYQVLSAQSGQAALDVLGKLVLREQPVAMMVADQRMPGMSGVEFLEAALHQAPRAKRVLLTAYADTSAAIKAINDVSLDHYLLKPWDPPEENLYPVLDDLLSQWQAEDFADSDGQIRVIGHRFSQDSHTIRDFLARNQVPHRWLDIERDEEAQQLLTAAHADGGKLPVVVFSDGEHLEVPDTLEVARRIGLETEARGDFYDLIIIGAGPAGLAGAVYGASEGLSTVIVERDAPGGQAGQSSRIENYLGFPTGLSGAELTRRANAQAQRFGAEFVSVSDVGGLEAKGPARVVRLGNGTELSAHAVLIATGVAYRKLGIPGSEELAGRGVYYGAARTEAAACQDEEVFVIGGANSAGQAAVYLAQRAAKVTILCRGDSLAKSMSQYLIDQIAAIPNIEVRTNARPTAAHGDDHLTALTVEDSDGERTEPCSSVFVFIGAAPRTDWLDGTLARDDRGFILSGPDLKAPQAPRPHWPLKREPLLLETSVPGVFVAGDVRHQSIKRVASAVGEGAMAVQFVHQYLGLQP